MSHGSRTKKTFGWVWTLLATVRKDRSADPKAPCEAWKNLIIVNADTEREALRKANKIGKSEAGDCQGSLRLNGKPGICKFLGVADMGLVHDQVGDGAEIIWEFKKCTLGRAMTLAQEPPVLLSRAKRERRNSVPLLRSQREIVMSLWRKFRKSSMKKKCKR